MFGAARLAGEWFQHHYLTKVCEAKHLLTDRVSFWHFMAVVVPRLTPGVDWECDTRPARAALEDCAGMDGVMVSATIIASELRGLTDVSKEKVISVLDAVCEDSKVLDDWNELLCFADDRSRVNPQLVDLVRKASGVW